MDGLSKRARDGVFVALCAATVLLWINLSRDMPSGVLWQLAALAVVLITVQLVADKALSKIGIRQEHWLIVELAFGVLIAAAVSWFAGNVFPGR